MNTTLKIACGTLVLALASLATPPLLAQDKYDRDLYIKAVKDGQYKNDMKAVADLVGMSEQQLFDNYIAKEFHLECVLRCSLFAKELKQDLPAVLKVASKYASGDDAKSKRWRKFYKDADVSDEIVARVTKQYDELAKTALRDTHQHQAEAAAQAVKIAALPPNPLAPLVIQKVAQRTTLPFGRVKDLVAELHQKQVGLDEIIGVAVFAAKTRHFDKPFLERITADVKGQQLLDNLCKAYQTTPELKEEILLVSNYIRDEIKNKDTVVPVKELLKETQTMRDTAAIIAQHTQVAAPKIITLLREIEGEEEVARACAVAHVTGKDVADIIKTKRTGGWFAVVAAYDIIEKMEEIQDTVFAIMTDYEKKMTPKNSTPEAGA